MAGLDPATIAMLQRQGWIPAPAGAPTPVQPIAPEPNAHAAPTGGYKLDPNLTNETGDTPPGMVMNPDGTLVPQGSAAAPQTAPQAPPPALPRTAKEATAWNGLQAPPAAPAAKPPVAPVPWQGGQGGAGAGGRLQLPNPNVVPAHDVRLVSPQTQAENLAALQAGKEAEVGKPGEGGAPSTWGTGPGTESEYGGGMYGAMRQQNAQAGQQALGEAGQYAASENENIARAKKAEREYAEHWDTQKTLDAEAAKGIDPQRAMKKLGIGGQFATAIAAAFGAFGASLTHTQNFAQQIIDKRINDDIDAQKLDVENAKGRAAAHRSEFAQKLAIFGDPKVAMDAAKADRYAFAAAKARYDSTQTNDRILKAKMSEAAAQWDMKAAAYNQETHKYIQAQATGGNPQAEILKRTQEIRNHSGGTITADAAAQQATAEWYAAHGVTTGAPGTYAAPGKGGTPAAALQGTLAALPPGVGQDWYDRNAPTWARSTAKLSEEAGLAGAARSYLKAIGGREPPPGKEGDEAAIRTAIGPRATPEAVAAFRKRAGVLLGNGAGAAPDIEDVGKPEGEEE